MLIKLGHRKLSKARRLLSKRSHPIPIGIHSLLDMGNSNHFPGCDCSVHGLCQLQKQDALGRIFPGCICLALFLSREHSIHLRFRARIQYFPGYSCDRTNSSHCTASTKTAKPDICSCRDRINRTIFWSTRIRFRTHITEDHGNPPTAV